MRKTILTLLVTFLLFGCHHRVEPEFSDQNSYNNNNNDEDKTNVENFVSIMDKEPYFKYAWHLKYNPNFLNTIDKDANIHVENAWKITQGEGIKIAVIDAGDFDTEHEDLKDNVIDVYNADYKDHKIRDMSDEPAHGSAVAGFIASPKNNVGLVGVAPKSKLILIQQVFETDSGTIEAFRYAAQQKANIISNSWGTNNVSEIVADYIKNLKEKNNITIIFASGNDGQNDDSYGIHDESELDSVIGVGATNEYNDVASYSNYGSNIDVLAPGGEFLGMLGVDETGEKGSDNQLSYVDDNYAFVSGTSFAAPITAGVAALMLSVNPSLTPDEIREILINTADKVGKNSHYNSNGFDIRRAYGKINATKAVKEALSLKK